MGNANRQTPFSPAKAEDVRNREREADEARKRELEDMRKMLGTDWGRRIAWRFLSEAHVYRTSFTGNSATFFNEGKRSMGLMLLSDITEAAPEAYLMMLQEQHEEANQ